MPESKSPKKKAPRPEHGATAARAKGNPRWLVPVMVGLMVLGLVWIVTYYLTSAGLGLPIPALRQWNLLIGFALIIAGFGLTTRWQ